MFQLGNVTQVHMLKQTSTTVGATASATVDTQGWNECVISVFLDSVAAVSNNPSVLKVQECDTSNGTFVDITGLEGDATDGFTVANGNTSNPEYSHIGGSLAGRKRYLKVIISPAGATQIVGASALLAKPKDSTEAEANLGSVAYA